MTTNKEMQDYWDESAGPKWVAQQVQLDAQLAPFGLLALDAAGLREGESVLDVGCGCGDTTCEISKRVGVDGGVVGIDLSRPMLELAGRRLAAIAGGATAEFLWADAQTHAFAGASFDAVVSRFGVMFFESPETAFSNLARATRPGGRLAFVCWQAREKNPWMLAPAAAALAYLDAPPPPDPDAPGPFTLADPDRVQTLLRGAGYAEITVDPCDTPLRFKDDDLEGATEMLLQVGPVAGWLGAQDPPADVRTKVREAVRGALAEFQTSEGLLAPAGAWVVRAERP